MTAGAVADLTVFDPDEGRLSDMLVEFNSPLLNNAVTQYLATDEDDTEMEGRLKNVLEGIVIGGPLEILKGAVKGTQALRASKTSEKIYHGIKGFKKMKASKNLDERAKIQKETTGVIDDIDKGKRTKRRIIASFEGNSSINLKQAVKNINANKTNAKKSSELWISKVINTGAFKSGEDVLNTIDNITDNAFDDVTKEYLENDILKNEVKLRTYR